MSTEKWYSLIELENNPKRVFLIDALGALLSSVSLGLVLPHVDGYFYMPTHILHLLAAIAMGFFIYSMSCTLLLKANWKPFFRVIVAFNIIYMLITIGLMLKFSEQLSAFDLIYFILELLVLAWIVRLEYRALQTEVEI